MKTTHKMKTTLLTAAAMLALAAPVMADPGHSHGGTAQYSAGSPGDPKKPSRMVLVTMKETDDGRMVYFPSSFAIKKGEQVKFVVTNAGEIPHEFVLASTEDNLKHAEVMKKFPEMEHDDPNNKTIQPKKKAEILWRFDKGGTFEISCLIPGHREAGMLAGVEVK